jgi:hypothetical protein
MPTKSPAQKRLMQAAAHTPGGYGGVPQSVGKKMIQHDRRGHNGSTRGRRDMAGRQHKGSGY